MAEEDVPERNGQIYKCSEFVTYAKVHVNASFLASVGLPCAPFVPRT